jgi:hypothetical protein
VKRWRGCAVVKSHNRDPDVDQRRLSGAGLADRLQVRGCIF